MIAVLWARGLLRRRLGRIAATASAVALVVALAGSLGAFIVFARAQIGRRAIAGTVVDWQIRLAEGVSPAGALAGLRPGPGAQAWAVAGYGDVKGFQSSVAGTVQTTGAGKVVGLSGGYRRIFPAQIRPLVGDGAVLLAQQTAANLHAGPGDEVTVLTSSGQNRVVRVDGIVDLPGADSFFQSVGAATGAGPQAPPDNVMLMPLESWRQIFDPAAGSGAVQVHVRLGKPVSPDPARAFARLLAQRRNYEARMAGAAAVGDNLGAHLDAARKDAAYGQLLFAFLGLPGIALGVALTLVGAGAGTERRRREQAQLRTWGASVGRLAAVAFVEAALVGVLGTIAGLGLAAAAGWGLWHVSISRTWGWLVAAAAVGLASSAFSMVVPAVRDARKMSSAQARRGIRPAMRRGWLTPAVWVLLAATAAAVWATTRSGYTVVAAAEGVPTVSVSYLSLAGPALAWIAGTLALTALAFYVLERGRKITSRMVRPIAGTLTGLVSGWLSRLHSVVARSVMLVALAVAYALSTAVFGASFTAQSRVDAQLTNGADVTASARPGVDLASYAPAIARISGVADVEPMQHRFAYVGNDLQDLYGVNPSRIGRATAISDAFFSGGRARAQLQRLASVPNGIFVADETVVDFQLKPGDTIRLRLLDASTHAYVPVPFKLLGVAREFPTAPTDSFLVANRAYVSKVTHSSSAETLLVKTGSARPPKVASEVRRLLPPASGAQVRDIARQRRITASGLVAVDMGGLTAVNLVFGSAATLWAVGLLLAVSLVERKRYFVILRALGAKTRHTAAFVFAESGMVAALGTLSGLALGGSVAWILVRVLHGIFDPPPAHPIIPWGYVAALAALLAAGVAAGAGFVLTRSAHTSPDALRDLAL